MKNIDSPKIYVLCTLLVIYITQICRRNCFSNFDEIKKKKNH